jgi:hypothetical protein
MVQMNWYVRLLQQKSKSKENRLAAPKNKKTEGYGDPPVFLKGKSPMHLVMLHGA